MTEENIETRIGALETVCARYDERIVGLKAQNQELKDMLADQNKGYDEFKQTMLDKLDAQRTLIITTLVGVLAAIVGSVVFVAVSRLW